MAAKRPLVLGDEFFEELQSGDRLDLTTTVSTEPLVQVSVPAVFRSTFTNASLSIAGVYVVTHPLNAEPAGVFIRNEVGELIWPDQVEVSGTTAIAVYLESFQPLAGTWSLTLTA